MRAETPLRPAPEVVGETDRGDDEDGGLGQTHDPADEREAQAPKVDAQRPAGEQQVGELPPAMDEAEQITSGRAVREVEFHLLDVEVRTRGVDRHPRLDAEARGHGEQRRARPAGEPALARQWLARIESAAQADEGPRRPLGEADAAALTSGEDGDRQIGIAAEEGSQVAGNVGVAQQQRPGSGSRSASARACPLPRRCRRTTLAPALLGGVSRVVARAVVGDDNLGIRQQGPQAAHGGADPLLLVACRNEDGEALAAHCDGVDGIGGTTPSVPLSPTP